VSLHPWRSVDNGSSIDYHADSRGKEVPVVLDAGKLRPFTPEELPSLFSYLSSEAVRNLILIGFLRVSLTSETQDGTFYGLFRNGNLRGVGLLGTVAAWAGGAEMARALGERSRDSGSGQVKLLVGLEREVESFLEASRDERAGRTETHLFYVLRRGDLNPEITSSISLHPAGPEEYDELFRIHNDLYLELTSRPLPEPATSAKRLLRRIQEGRVWVAGEGSQIQFKSDVASETDDAVLIESVWTRPDLRGGGIGSKALSHLCSHLLSTHPLVCLYFRKDQSRLKSFYERIGFRYHGAQGDYTITRY
jgi:ribosomal protein S18 acetylase RimI-like enzyme